MNSSTEGRGPECVAGELIEEHAVQLRRSRQEQAGETPADERPAALDEHVRTCAACGSRMAKAEEEAALMGVLLSGAPVRPQSECPSIEDLAQYLDGGLDEAGRLATVAHMASCQKCQHRLVQLYREVRAVTAGDSSGAETAGDRVAFDEIKTHAAAREVVEKASTSDESAQDSSESTESSREDGVTGVDSEERKRRYSSQSD